MSQRGSSEAGKAIVVRDPRFAEVMVPELGDELAYLRAAAQVAEDDANTLKLRVGRIEALEALEKMISFVCPTDFKTRTIIQCHERRRSYDCVCDARRRWIERYIL